MTKRITAAGCNDYYLEYGKIMRKDSISRLDFVRTLGISGSTQVEGVGKFSTKHTTCMHI